MNLTLLLTRCRARHRARCRNLLFCFLLLLGSLWCGGSGVANAGEAQPAPERKNLYAGGDFDQWDWVPIAYYGINGMKALKKAGLDLNCEVRGPLYRVPLGLDTSGPCGYMVEGSAAHQGKSVRFVANDPKNPFIMGQYCSGLRTASRIGYDVWAKGKGKVGLHVWLSGFNKTTGKVIWVGFPDIFSIKPTAEWVRYSGTFTFPAPPDAAVVMDRVVYARLLVDSGSDLMLDDLQVWEEPPAAK